MSYYLKNQKLYSRETLPMKGTIALPTLATSDVQHKDVQVGFNYHGAGEAVMYLTISFSGQNYYLTFPLNKTISFNSETSEFKVYYDPLEKTFSDIKNDRSIMILSYKSNAYNRGSTSSFTCDYTVNGNGGFTVIVRDPFDSNATCTLIKEDASSPLRLENQTGRNLILGENKLMDTIFSYAQPYLFIEDGKLFEKGNSAGNYIAC